MAVTSPPSARIAPAWVVPLHLAGLGLVFLGQRVFAALEAGAGLVTALGVAATAGATAVRFAPGFRVGGERRESEQLQGLLAALTLVALAGYAVTTDWGLGVVGLDVAETATRERWVSVIRVAWIAALVVALVPMVLAELAMLPMRLAQTVESRRVRAAAAAGLSLGLAASYGALFVYASSAAELRADYSYFKTSRPSESTRAVVESIGEPVKAVAFFPQVNEVRGEVERYLRELSAASPRLEVEVQDRLLVPKLAKELKATQDGVIVLSKGGVTESLVIGSELKSARAKLKTLDRDFQEVLLKLVRSRRIAYLTTGHGEITDTARAGGDSARTARGIRTLLQKQNYLLKDLGLAQGLGNEIPADADLVLVVGPSEPFLPEEIAALERYATRGGKLFLAVDPDVAFNDLTPEEQPPLGEDSPPEPRDAPATPGASAAAPSASGAASSRPAASVSAARPVGSAAPSASAPRPPASASPPASAATAPPHPPGPMPGIPAAAAPPAAPALQALAGVVGLTVLPGVLANEQQHVRRRFNDSDRTLVITNRYSSHASVTTLSRNSQRAVTVYGGAAGLERKAGAAHKVDFAVRSMANTFNDVNKTYRHEEGAGEKKTTFNLAAAVTLPAPGAPPLPDPDLPAQPGEKQKKPAGPLELRAFVVADADAFTDFALANAVANQLLFVDAVRWLGGEESFSGEVNVEEDVRIEHTKGKDLVWFYSTILGAPALVLGLGLWFARRSTRRGAAKEKAK
ncbi:MAG: Gldg family protein [Polyangiaceae bacterium]|nr:Gldg family protein [Polyangiaceae bacterium]